MLGCMGTDSYRQGSVEAESRHDTVQHGHATWTERTLAQRGGRHSRRHRHTTGEGNRVAFVRPGGLVYVTDVTAVDHIYTPTVRDGLFPPTTTQRLCFTRPRTHPVCRSPVGQQRLLPNTAKCSTRIQARTHSYVRTYSRGTVVSARAKSTSRLLT